ncbi:hypothetical protein [Natrialba sp. INN-245]|uniref:hypothetical protein n=1 Tax=Natrialba sp. INN-245 TaxID=2690967 RepID=UPI001310F74B|nr:hypothetical protein [Natrialba sp. INN-245]MWV41056.1 hypothetical protein [Natrialba sp. INN-245]
MSQKPDSPPGQGDGGGGQPQYQIDETVTLDEDERYVHWDIDVDPSKEETWVIRAIARSSRTKLRAFILPKEELDHFKEGENVWWEYRSSKTDRLQAETSITHKDEDPYYHDGDSVLVLRITTASGAPDNPKFSVKFRRE